MAVNTLRREQKHPLGNGQQESWFLAVLTLKMSYNALWDFDGLIVVDIRRDRLEEEEGFRRDGIVQFLCMFCKVSTNGYNLATSIS